MIKKLVKHARMFYESDIGFELTDNSLSDIIRDYLGVTSIQEQNVKITASKGKVIIETLYKEK